MKERPILFSGVMVRALLAGTKTQTRRIVKPQPACGCYWAMNGNRDKALHLAKDPSLPGGISFVLWNTDDCVRVIQGKTPVHGHQMPCPYGRPGDRLWVRETLRRNPATNEWEYADGKVVALDRDDPRVAAMIGWAHHKDGDTCVSIHMPRWASRITLEITDVRVERVQEISEDDARAEGVDGIRDMRFATALGNIHSTGHRLNFIDLWCEINGPDSWAENSFVWVVSFKRVIAQPHGG